MANIPITDNTTLLNTLKTKAQALPSKSSGSSGSVDLSGITATAEDILAGKKSVNSSGNEITGTMTNRGAWTASKTSNGDVTIPAGYHNGSGKVTVNVSTTIETGELDTPAVSFDTTSGKFTATAKVKTGGYIGASATKTNTYTLTRYLGGTITPTKNDQTIPLSGEYCTGDLIVKGDSNLVSEHIAKGWSIFGIPGSYTGDGASILPINTDRAWDYDVDDSYSYHRIAYAGAPVTGVKYVVCMAMTTSGTYDSSETNNADSVEAIMFDAVQNTCYIRTSDSLSTIDTEVNSGAHPAVIFKNDSTNGFAVYVKGTYLCYSTYKTLIIG